MTEPPQPASPDAPRDRWRAVRRTVAQVTIAFTVLFLAPLLQHIAGLDRQGPQVQRSATAWAVWLTGLAAMVLASLVAVRVLRVSDSTATGRATAVRGSWWCGGLLLTGFVLITIYSNLAHPAR